MTLQHAPDTSCMFLDSLLAHPLTPESRSTLKLWLDDLEFDGRMFGSEAGDAERIAAIRAKLREAA